MNVDNVHSSDHSPVFQIATHILCILSSAVSPPALNSSAGSSSGPVALRFCVFASNGGFFGVKLSDEDSRFRGSKGRCYSNRFWLSIYGVHIDATWRIRLNRPSAAAMRPYVKLLWPTYLFESDHTRVHKHTKTNKTHANKKTRHHSKIANYTDTQRMITCNSLLEQDTSLLTNVDFALCITVLQLCSPNSMVETLLNLSKPKNTFIHLTYPKANLLKL